MDPTPVSEIAKMSGCELVRESPPTLISRICTDTRKLLAGDCYVALRGEHFDGNAFAADAIARGAGAVLLDDRAMAQNLPEGCAVLLAEDGLSALTRMAAEWRARLSLTVLCITGSNGKTSTKEFTAAVLQTKFRISKTEGNLNNHIGLPLTILATSSRETFAVWEIGMNHGGEIAPLAALAHPHAGIITNIGIAHIEHLLTREAIAWEKGFLAAAIPAAGCLFLSADDDKSAGIALRCAGRVIMVGLPGGVLSAEALTETEEGCGFTVCHGNAKIRATIPANGSHMVRNALLALAAGLEFGVSLKDGIAGLAKARLADGRLQRRELRGVVFLDDTYNANPDSMEAALATLKAIPGIGRRIAVLGRMGELGDYEAEGYRRTGVAAANMADVLVTVGAEANQIAAAARAAGLNRIHEVDDTASAARMLRSLARMGDIVLVKGSRSARMETVLTHFNT